MRVSWIIRYTTNGRFVRTDARVGARMDTRLKVGVEQGIQLPLVNSSTIVRLRECIEEIFPDLLIALDLSIYHPFDVSQYSVDHLNHRF